MLNIDAIIGAFPSRIPNMHLFEGKITPTGYFILISFTVAIAIFIVISLLRAKRAKQMENFPPIYGDADQLLEQLSDITGLGLSERWLLRKLAREMRIPQPTAFLLSPELLSQASDFWQQRHNLATTKAWGIAKLDYISRQVFSVPISELYNRQST